LLHLAPLVLDNRPADRRGQWTGWQRIRSGIRWGLRPCAVNRRGQWWRPHRRVLLQSARSCGPGPRWSEHVQRPLALERSRDFHHGLSRAPACCGSSLRTAA